MNYERYKGGSYRGRDDEAAESQEQRQEQQQEEEEQRASSSQPRPGQGVGKAGGDVDEDEQASVQQKEAMNERLELHFRAVAQHLLSAGLSSSSSSSTDHNSSKGQGGRRGGNKSNGSGSGGYGYEGVSGPVSTNVQIVKACMHTTLEYTSFFTRTSKIEILIMGTSFCCVLLRFSFYFLFYITFFKTCSIFSYRW
jgi:hypothetical protein